MAAPKEELLRAGSIQHPESPFAYAKRGWAGPRTWFWLPRLTEGEHRWTILFQADRWQFSLPTDLCWLLSTNKTKPLQQIYSTQKDSVQRESSFHLARQGNFHAIILELDFIFMTVLEGGNFDWCYRVACACLGKALWEMLYFLWMKAGGNDAVCLWRLCHSHQADGFLESTCICLLAFTTKNMSLCYFVTTLIKSSDEDFLTLKLFSGKEEDWLGWRGLPCLFLRVSDSLLAFLC